MNLSEKIRRNYIFTEAVNPDNIEDNKMIAQALKGPGGFRKNEEALKKLGITGTANDETGEVTLSGIDRNLYSRPRSNYQDKYKRAIETYSTGGAFRDYEKGDVDDSFDYKNYLTKPTNKDILPKRVQDWRRDPHRKGHKFDPDWEDKYQAGGISGNLDDGYLSQEEKSLNKLTRKYVKDKKDLKQATWDVNYHKNRVNRAEQDLKKAQETYDKEISYNKDKIKNYEKDAKNAQARLDRIHDKVQAFKDRNK